MSRIEWTETTWNPVTGCTKVSAGCKHCYAERMANRLQKIGLDRYRNGFEVTLHEELIELPLTWRKPRTVFVNSMSDLFHSRVPDDFIRRVFATMQSASQHTFQVLTKRTDRLSKLAPTLTLSPNVWLGASVESNKVLGRIDDLRGVGAAVRFLSVEPLLERLENLNLRGIHWVIVGGESGPGARALDADWVREIRDSCSSLSIPFFFKQWGGVQKGKHGRELDGRTWDDLPQRPNRAKRIVAQSKMAAAPASKRRGSPASLAKF